MAVTDSALLVPRKRPAQARSQERFDRILQAARDVLVQTGFESFTFDEVASRADVPIGSIYQYFANKYVLICELDRVDTAEAVTELTRFSRRVPALEWPEVLSEFIDHLATMWWQDPSRRAVWHAIQSTPATRFTAAHTEKPVIEIIANTLRTLIPDRDYRERGELASLLIHTVTSLLNFAVRDANRGRGYFDTAVAEIKRMLLAYLFAVAEN